MQGGRNNGPSKNAIDIAQSSSISSVVKCGQPTTPGIDWTRRDNAPPSRDQRNSSSSATALGQVSQVYPQKYTYNICCNVHKMSSYLYIYFSLDQWLISPRHTFIFSMIHLYNDVIFTKFAFVFYSLYIFIASLLSGLEVHLYLYIKKSLHNLHSFKYFSYYFIININYIIDCNLFYQLFPTIIFIINPVD